MDFTLRPWKMSDINTLVQYANNERIASNMMNRFPHPYTLENGRSFLESATKNVPVSLMAIEVANQSVGGIGLHLQEDIQCKNAELGYWLAEPFWGKGIITKAVIQMVKYGFNTWEINRIFARPFGPNKASQRVLEKAGFILEARFAKTFYKNGVFLDELVYAIRKQL